MSVTGSGIRSPVEKIRWTAEAQRSNSEQVTWDETSGTEAKKNKHLLYFQNVKLNKQKMGVLSYFTEAQKSPKTKNQHPFFFYPLVGNSNVFLGFWCCFYELDRVLSQESGVNSLVTAGPPAVRTGGEHMHMHLV